MLIRTVHPNGVITYQSPLLAALRIPHAFSTRIGGVSAPPFDSLNLGNPGPDTGATQQDASANIAENYRRLQEAVVPGRGGVFRAWVHQIHSTRVELLEAEPESDYSETLDAEIRDRFHGQTQADALITNLPNVLLTVRIADCLPLLLASDDGRYVAAIHAGWRGLVGGIIPKTLRALAECGLAPGRLVAALGPAISAPQFEVGPEVAAAFTAAGLAAAVSYPQGPSAKPHADLVAAARSQLHSAGLTRIDTHDLCTFRDSSDFFSHRRDHGTTGRLAAVIMLP